MTEKDDLVLQLRASRARVEAVKEKLRLARRKQEELEQEISGLLAEQREARAKRREAVLAADAGNVPRLTIAKEVGMQRGNVYKLLDAGQDDES